MRIVLAPSGTPGEIEMMYAFAGALRDRGHHILFCAPESYRSRIMKLGYSLVSSGANFLEYLDSDSNRSEDLARKLIEELPVQFVSFRDALREADLVIGTTLQLGAASVAEKRGIPYVSIVFSPVLLDRKHFPNIGVPKSSGFLSKLRARPFTRLWEQVRVVLNRERAFSHLEPVMRLYDYVFSSGDRIVAVDPAFASVESQPKQTVTGFWFFDSTDSEPSLPANGKLVYVGQLHHRQLEQDVAADLKSAGFEPILWNQSELENVPLSSIVRKVLHVVHSGSGYVAASAARFGLTQTVLPFLEEESYWADRIQQLGIGKIIPERSVRPVVDAVMATASDSKMQENAKRLGEQIQSRNGLAEAADKIDEIALR